MKIFYLCFSLLCSALPAFSATLQDGTTVAVRLIENVNGSMSEIGDPVYFELAENVVVGDELVLQAGTFVTGMVFDAEKRKAMGKGGRLILVPKSLTTAAGQIIKFERDPLFQEGRKRTGATVAHVVMWGPIGLIAKGRAAYMFRDTEFDITVSGSYEIPALNESESQVDIAHEVSDFSVEFEPYKSKINYRKGKIGKDFIVKVAESDNYEIKDIEIYAVDGIVLPHPIAPIATYVNKKDKSQYFVKFAFTDIVKYALPDPTDFAFRMGDQFKSEARLTTKWKLK